MKRTAVSTRDWGVFGLRWAIPAALLVTVLTGDGGTSREFLTPAVLLTIGMAVLNLTHALLLLGEVWNRLFVLPLLLVDAAVAAAVATWVDPGLAWMGLVPAALVGFTFGWAAAVLHGILAAGLLVAGKMLITGAAPFASPGALALLAGYPAAGVCAAFLSQPGAASRAAALHQAERERLLEDATRRAKEVMAVVYDMSEVLSASRLDPNRVLDSALTFGLEGLARVGVKPPLFGAVLLFAEGDDDDEGAPVLRVARTSSTVAPADRAVEVPGVAGAISRALTQFAPALSHAPDVDPELCLFESFRTCQTVLCLPLKSGPDSYGVMITGSQAEDAFEDLHVDLMWAVANQASASLNNAKLYASLLRQRDRIVEVERNARAQLAADLHDGPTQGMSAITMRLNYIRRLLDKKPEAAVDELYKIEDLARRTTKEVRMMLFELRPKALEHGLTSGLDQLAKKMQETYSQNVDVRVEPGVDALLDTQTSVTLFSIVTEALHNARKHARAELIQVTVRVRGDALMLAVEDDGRGFDVAEALAAASEREGHLGLNNLFDRAALIEGVLNIQSEPGRGSRISVSIPLEALRVRQADEISRALTGPDVIVSPPAGGYISR